MKQLLLVLALASCGKKSPALVETKLGDTGMSIDLPAGVTVKIETPTTFSLDRGNEPYGLINDIGMTEWPDGTALQAGFDAACTDLADPKPFETANMRGISCSKGGKHRTVAYVKVYNAKTKNVQSCNVDAEEGKDVCLTLSGSREHH
jgi:hypothetical protein